jgi:hypothetical protein
MAFAFAFLRQPDARLAGWRQEQDAASHSSLADSQQARQHGRLAGSGPAHQNGQLCES